MGRVRRLAALLAGMGVCLLVSSWWLGSSVTRALPQLQTQLDAAFPGYALRPLAQQSGLLHSVARYRIESPVAAQAWSLPVILQVYHGPIGWAWDGLFIGRYRARLLLDGEAPDARVWREFAAAGGMPFLFEIEALRTVLGTLRGSLQIPSVRSVSGDAGSLDYAGLRISFSQTAGEILAQGESGDLELYGTDGRFSLARSEIDARVSMLEALEAETPDAIPELGVQLRLRLPRLLVGSRDARQPPSAGAEDLQLDLALSRATTDLVHGELRLHNASLQGVFDVEALVASWRLEALGDGAYTLQSAGLRARGEGGELVANAVNARLQRRVSGAAEAAGYAVHELQADLRVARPFAMALLAPWPSLLEELVNANWLVDDPTDATDGEFRAAVELTPGVLRVNGAALPRGLLECAASGAPVCIPQIPSP